MTKKKERSASSKKKIEANLILSQGNTCPARGTRKWNINKNIRIFQNYSLYFYSYTTKGETQERDTRERGEGRSGLDDTGSSIAPYIRSSQDLVRWFMLPLYITLPFRLISLSLSVWSCFVYAQEDELSAFIVAQSVTASVWQLSFIRFSSRLRCLRFFVLLNQTTAAYIYAMFIGIIKEKKRRFILFHLAACWWYSEFKAIYCAVGDDGIKRIWWRMKIQFTLHTFE